MFRKAGKRNEFTTSFGKEICYFYLFIFLIADGIEDVLFHQTQFKNQTQLKKKIEQRRVVKASFFFLFFFILSIYFSILFILFIMDVILHKKSYVLPSFVIKWSYKCFGDLQVLIKIQNKFYFFIGSETLKGFQMMKNPQTISKKLACHCQMRSNFRSTLIIIIN